MRLILSHCEADTTIYEDHRMGHTSTFQTYHCYSRHRGKVNNLLDWTVQNPQEIGSDIYKIPTKVLYTAKAESTNTKHFKCNSC